MRYVTNLKESEILRLKGSRPLDITLLSIRNGKIYLEINGAVNPACMRVHKIMKTLSLDELRS